MRRHHLDLGALTLGTVGALVVFVALAVFVPVLTVGLGPPTTFGAVVTFLIGALLRALVGLLVGLRVTAKARRPTALSTVAPGFLGGVLAFVISALFSMVVSAGSGQGMIAAPLDALSGVLQWSVEGGLGGLAAYGLAMRRREGRA